MARPLNAPSMEDVDGYLQELIDSLNDDDESPSQADVVESAADYVLRLVESVSEPDSTFSDEQQEPALVEESRVIANAESNDEPVSSTDDEAFTQDHDIQLCQPQSDPAEKIHYEAPVDLVPRPTGNAYTISQLREVANLTVRDALNAYRCKQLISNAYGIFVFAFVCLFTAMLVSCFGVNQPGFARLIALASIALGGLSTFAYLVLLFAISRSNVKLDNNELSPAPPTVPLA